MDDCYTRTLPPAFFKLETQKQSKGLPFIPCVHELALHRSYVILTLATNLMINQSSYQLFLFMVHHDNGEHMDLIPMTCSSIFHICALMCLTLTPTIFTAHCAIMSSLHTHSGNYCSTFRIPFKYLRFD